MSSRPLESKPVQGVVTRREPWWSRHRTWLILVAILCMAAFFRFTGTNFDEGTNQHPDERFIVGQSLEISWPTSTQNMLDAHTSPLNLRRDQIGSCNSPTGCEYPYGSLPVYLTRATGWVLDTILPATKTWPKGYFLQGYQGTTLLGRTLSSIFDLITVLLVFLIGRRLYSRSTGLIAAALVAFAVTHIQLAHFYASDTPLTTFMIGTLYFSVVLMQKPSWWAAMGAGTCLGLAIASKVSIAPFALLIVAALVLRALYRKRTRKLGAEFGDPIGVRPASAAERERSFGAHLARSTGYLVIAGVFSLLAFGITEPYVLMSLDWSYLLRGNLNAMLEPSPWWQGIKHQAFVQSGQADYPFTRQYIGTTPLLYHLQNLVFWGLSPIPGLVTLTGFVVGIWNALKRKPAEVLMVAGAIPYFATILTLEAKWMRYMLPLVPIFCLLGAAFLVRGVIWERKRREARGAGEVRAGRQFMAVVRGNAFAIAAVMSVGGAFLWAVAFMNIYTQEHSRVQASRWIYANVPNKARLSKEGWDDIVPLAVSGAPARSYGPTTEFNLYDDQPAEQEFTYIKGLLGQTDYIVLASNRLYGSIPRLPWRYPVQTRFYELLFDGKLGYVNAHTQHTMPSLLGINFDDQLADESFTVYDHPRVDVFKKVTTLTDDQLRSLFSTALNRPTSQYRVAAHGTVADDKSLTYKQYGPAIPYNKPVSALPDVGDFSWNPLAQEDTQWIGVVLWLLVVYALGFAALPIIFTVARNLPDRAYPLSKVVGLLLTAWGMWLAASAHLIPFTAWGVLLMALLMGALSAVSWRLGAGQEIKEFFRKKGRLIAFYEVVFLLAFAAFLVIRVLNPDMWHPWNGGEKPMELGFLNSILRSAWMPPLDPFFSGGFINYYYYGHFVVACLIKLTGMDPAVAFNVAIPTLYALAFVGAVSLVYNVVAWSQRRRGSKHEVSASGLAFGLLCGVLMLVVGNMHGFFQWIRLTFPSAFTSVSQMFMSVDAIRGLAGRESFDFWGARSIIPGTINEFPFWTFLFADLHPHLIDMPFTLLTAVLSLNLALSGKLNRSMSGKNGNSTTRGERARENVMSALEWMWGRGWVGALRFGLTAVALGALAVINSWDFPTFMAVAGGAALIAMLVAARDSRAISRQEDGFGSASVGETRRMSAGERWTLYGVGVASVGALAGAALLAYLPFFLNFKAFYTDILPLVDGSGFMRRTTVGEFLVMWLLFIFITLSYLVVRLWRFPWRAALSEVQRLVPAAPRRVTRASMPQQAFSLKSPFGKQQPQLATALASSGGQISEPATSMHFQAEQQESGYTGVSEQEAHEQPAETLEGSQSKVDAEANGYGAEGAVIPEQNVSGDGYVSAPLLEYAPGHWLADAHSQAQIVVAAAPQRDYPGVIPVSAGIGLLAVTAALTGLQIATGQYLLALLVALLGGIVATTLASTRSAPALFTGLLLVGALALTMGVELVYLADHLRGGDSYRMNTVFKFYVQAWVLFAAGSAAAVYYILHGLREGHLLRRAAKKQDIGKSEQQAIAGATDVVALLPQNGSASVDGIETTHLGAELQVGNGAHHAGDERPVGDNWMVWSAVEPDTTVAQADEVIPNAPVMQTTQTTHTERIEAPERLTVEETRKPGIRWTAGRLAWTGLLGLLVAATLAYPLLGVPARVADRFPGAKPSVGTLNGMKYMTVGSFTTDASAFPIMLKYDYQAIRWMNEHISGQKVIAEIPLGYYREDGMRAASNTGLSMVVGGLHQGEQRADVYERLVGERNTEMNEFFSTTDVQRALTLMSKYDIDYIYAGQLEEARGGVGLRKFDQMAEPKVGILKQVFSVKDPDTGHGTTIYQVIRDSRIIVGAPVQGSGIPGISITPIPTPTATPFPTPPVDDPTLKALISDVAGDPTNRDKRMKLVEWYSQHNYHVDAARELTTLVAQDPQNVALRHQQGDAYQAAGQPDKALKAWEDARDIDNNNPPGHNKVGIAYIERGRYDDAVREFQAATQEASDFVEAWFHLGEAFEAKGDVDNARASYQQVIDKSATPSSWSDNARDRLSKLK